MATKKTAAASTTKKTATKKSATKETTAAKKPAVKKAPAAKKTTVTAKKKSAATGTAKPGSTSKGAGGKSLGTKAYEQIGAIAPYKQKKGEEYMSVGMREHFRLILLKWKQELMEEVDRTMGHMKQDAANFADPADRASQEEEFSLELRTRDRERKLLRKIDEAITRLDLNEYGYCESCGIEIGIRRLEARPTAELCIDCKTLQELKERQKG